MIPLGFFLTVLFIPGALNGATAGRWALLSICIPAICMFNEMRLTLAHLVGILFLAYLGISLAWTPVLYDGFEYYWHWLVLAGVFCLGSMLVSLRTVFIGLALGLYVNAVFMGLQLFSWLALNHAWDEVLPFSVNRPAGLFLNGSYAAEAAALILVGLVVYRLWVYVPAAVLCLVLPVAQASRASYAALMLVLIVYLYPRFRITTYILILVLFTVGILWFTSGEHNNSVGQRVLVWLDTWDGLTFWGKGVGSYYVNYPEHASRIHTILVRPDHAHNDFLEILYELGPIGFTLFCGILYAAFRQRRSEGYILLAFAALAVVDFPSYLPVTAFIGALVAGFLCGHGRPLRDVLTHWGTALFGRFLLLEVFRERVRASSQGS